MECHFARADGPVAAGCSEHGGGTTRFSHPGYRSEAGARQAPAPAAWNLAAEFQIELGPKLREAVDRGLPLQFTVDFQLMRARWYWMDEEVVNTTYPLNLSYNALTRTYRVVTPNNTYNTPTLEDAMQHMVKVRDWAVIPRDRIEIGEPYTAQVRFRLLLTELPKPFQISALVNSEWDLSSEWLAFEFTPKREAWK